MKRFFAIAILLAVSTIPALATNDSQSITISDPVTVGSSTLPAGDYKVTWTGTAPTVQVTIAAKNSHHPVTVNVPATLIQKKNDSSTFTTNSNTGVNKLESIQLKNVSLVFTGAPAPGQ